MPPVAGLLLGRLLRERGLLTDGRLQQDLLLAEWKPRLQGMHRNLRMSLKPAPKSLGELFEPMLGFWESPGEPKDDGKPRP